MAQFDVWRTRDGDLVIDCQSELLTHLNTRLVVPLLHADQFDVVAHRLNPLFTVEETSYVMYTQFAAAIPVSQLGEVVMSLNEEGLTITGALDVLLTGV
ncbi:CcdB family protein [Sphingopyxis indica]|uniref:Toxin CcdB n=1 Tax=Sphingopyxis indica TaxID=436663 RepID=A0A239HYT2_9SPHN|nr:CcdB family protein [Sphingopyxis indica]WOF43199.1 CcdB family protein [Sphingopyxis indica]SNS86389.1 toxin CcdB [Sphingopyxis indica]